ncbi:DUF3533 domain-containing protein [Streptomyces sp. WMMC1477]|uniref:DUF3533 domain-containing protein n=1 Tax=Streptomyces sp. WMMC1477 TaxID=3015155 RepID=UPI0022B6D283|nr:DUF3533 domain-containing protein [Streptomyces sp. WMMC1477]MCZ7432360.1 DUF3533 domain-containing protein [Streptomyces sp. WMMC1477]
MATLHAGGSESFFGQVRSAVSLRAAALLLGVLALQMGFIASYVGAFHEPGPERVPVAVVAPDAARAELTDNLDGLPGDPLDVEISTADPAEARDALEDRDVDGVFLAEPGEDADTLLVAGAAGGALAQAIESVFEDVQRERDRGLTVRDTIPAASGDARALTSFYLVVGWTVGGYLCAAILAMSYGARPGTPARAVARLGALGLYAVAAGIGGAALVGPVLDALPGGFWALSGLGALLVYAVGALTFALQGLFGVIGIGLAIGLVVVIGNPSAGGAYPAPLLPEFWRAVGPAFPPGAGTWTARSIAYFDGAAITGPLVVLAAWAVAGTAVTFLAAFRHTPAEYPR